MKFEDIAKLSPNKFTEECALISVYFTMNRIKGDWFLNYINAPGGAWQELKILKDDIEKRFYMGKIQKRPDLVMQKDSDESVFYLAEAKEFFRLIMQEREKIDLSLKSIYSRINKLSPKKSVPVYSYIIGIDTTGLKGEYLDDAVDAEINYIKKSIEKLPTIEGGRVCMLVYWKDNKTTYSLIFSNDFSKKVADIFRGVFL
ncbi:MAG: hypothetical protein HUU49_01880 [Candidatus Buchananbacteria bacterium]|nr:hypothetical protein [Candidatus Buchananbacteria bacterium]